MLKKLRIQFVCTMMSIVTVLLAVIIGMVLHFTAGVMENQSIRMLQNLSAGPFRLEEISEENTGMDFPFFIVQIGRRGELITVTGSNFTLTEEEMSDSIRLAMESKESSGLLEDVGLRFQKNLTPAGQSIFFADTTLERENMNRLKLTCAGLFVGGFLVFFLLSLFLARKMIRPVEEAWNQQRQFIADASHELKTPLAVIMTNAELLQESDPEDSQRKQFASSILTMSRQMRRLVEGLLELARVDNGAIKGSFAPVDLSALAEEAALSFEVLFFEQGMPLTTEITPQISLTGSAAHLLQMVDILLDNALKYAEPDGDIQLKLTRQGSHALLSLSSPGREISLEDLKRIFQRFYRIDEARTRNGSYGLGLSIARAIAQEHGGRIWAESREGRNTFFVQLPII